MKALLKAMAEKPTDASNPRLYKQHRERWLEAEKALLPHTPWDLSPDELRHHGLPTCRVVRTALARASG